MKSWKTNGDPLDTFEIYRLQWGHDDEVVEYRTVAATAAARPTRFNGATTMKSWKAHPANQSDHCARLASMGPRR